MQVDFSKLQEQVTSLNGQLAAQKTALDNQVIVLQGIVTDYSTMQAQIAALQAAINANDPAAIQALVDAITETLKASNTNLTTNITELNQTLTGMVAADESVAPPPPPNP